MIDTRLNSVHLESLYRRQVFRRTRRDLLAARGWLTEAAECLRSVPGEVSNGLARSPDRPDQVLGGVKFVLIDPQTGHSHALQIGLNTIGRLRNNDIVLHERRISRRHCVLLVHADGSCELHDMASRNGTFVNGQRIWQPVPLTSGDWIQVDEKWLQFLIEED